MKESGVKQLKTVHSRSGTRKRLVSRLRMLSVLALFLLTSEVSLAQEPAYEEILVSLTVQGIGGTELSALIDGEQVWLPVADVFNFLKIKNASSARLDSLSGFFINEGASYVIDKTNNSIYYKKKLISLKPDDLIKTETGLYMKLPQFGEVFELDGVFNFRALLITINTKLELPLIRELRLDMVRRNMSRLKGEIEADVVFPKTKKFFVIGAMDWSITANQLVDVGQNDNRYGLGLGAMLGGGELKAYLNLSERVPFKERNQYYLWRHVNNSNRLVRQISAGRIIGPSISSLFAPVTGVQVTNAPTTLRRSFGTYTISNTTEPGWTVELYVNNVLVDFKNADATGFYTFEVPIVYGNSAIKLRFYGPYGEERTKEENVNIPFNFLPKKELEYTLTAGVVRDDSNSRYSRGVFNYGLGSRITVGAGMEYLTSVTSGHYMPFATTSARLSRNLIVAGEYAHGVRTKGFLSYRTRFNSQLDLTYTRYKEGQTAINVLALEERRAVLAVPLKGRRLSMFSLLTVNQTVLASTKYTTAEWMLSGLIFRRNASISTYGVFTQEADPYIYSNISTSFNFFRTLLLTPEIQYEYNTGKVIAAKGTLEKRFGRNFMASISYEENFKSNLRNIGTQLRYDLPFAQVGVTARKFNESLSLLEIARGSVMFDPKTNYAVANNNISVSKGGIELLPFLDLNCNGIKDPGERKVSGLKFRINSGKILPESKDTIIRIPDLEPFANYYIELNKYSFDNIAWQINNKVLKVMAEPNSFKLIEVPVAVYGEANGNVVRSRNGNLKGQGQISICFYKNDSLVAKTISEPDGYFSFLGLPPGTYTARVDSTQLQKINMEAEPLAIPFTINASEDGDMIDALDFTLTSTLPEKDEEKKAPAK